MLSIFSEKQNPESMLGAKREYARWNPVILILIGVAIGYAGPFFMETLPQGLTKTSVDSLVEKNGGTKLLERVKNRQLHNPPSLNEAEFESFGDGASGGNKSETEEKENEDIPKTDSGEGEHENEGDGHEGHSEKHGEHNEGEEGGEEEEEEFIGKGQGSFAITCIILVLFALTIMFEELKEFIEETYNKSDMAPIIESLFAEMTVLGFVSVFTFALTKSGIFGPAANLILGAKEGEHELLELFEEVHYGLFFMMLFYVFYVLVIIKEGITTADEWNKNEHGGNVSSVEKYVNEVEELIEWHKERKANQSVVARVFRRYFLGRSNEIAQMHEKLVYYALRQEFIEERSLQTPFEPSPPGIRVSEAFNFARYLGMCFGKVVGHSVNIETNMWVILAILNIAFYFVVKSLDYDLTNIAWAWCGVAYVLTAINVAFEAYLRGIRLKLVNFEGLENKIKSLKKIIKDEPMIGANDTIPSTESSALLEGEKGPLPDWCNIDVEGVLGKQSWLSKILTRAFVGNTSPNIQQSMFIFHEYGTRFNKWVFQLNIFLTALYTALLLRVYLPVMYNEYGEENVGVFVAYVVISFLPIVMMRINRIYMVRILVQVESVGALRRHQIVSRVNLEKKTATVVHAFLVIYKIQKLLNEEEEKINRVVNGRGLHGVKSFRSNSLATALRNNAIMDSFDIFDKEGRGRIHPEVLKKVLLTFTKNEKIHDEVFFNVFSSIDMNSDGFIVKEEFVIWYRSVMSMEEANYASTKERAKFLFDMFDEDDSGHISFGEFKSSLDKFDIGFTVDDIGSLMYELDDDGDGMISEDEFVALIAKYSPK